jgi:hAT family C-terminal dimerisation region
MLKVNSLWEKFCRENQYYRSSNTTSTLASASSSTDQTLSIGNFEKIRRNLKHKHIQPQSLDEFENYCNEASSYDIRMPALNWWLQETQRKRWPQLSRWAIGILSIPSMSDKPERVFSGGRRTVTWDKTSMMAATLEQLECGRDWKRGDLLKEDF